MNLKKENIVVIAGGISNEREVSLRSGTGCFEALKNLGYNVQFLDLKTLDDLIELHKKQKIDKAFLCTHGNYGEDGKLQSVLEWFNISYTGSKVLSSALCMNKYFTREILKSKNLKVAKGGLLNEYKPEEFPVMIKALESGSSYGIEKINNKEELEKYFINNSQNYLVEQFISGREVTVSLLEIKNKLTVLPILELKPKNEFYDLEAKYTEGMTEFILPAPFTEEERTNIENIAIKAFNALNCSGFGRVDMIIPLNSLPVILEINTLPGMTNLSDLPAQAKEAGIKYEELVELMLKTIE